MSENVTPRPAARRYAGRDVDITYDARRCIHAAHCVERLSAVFDKDRRPWIAPDNATSGEVAAVIPLCPSGALHYERKDADEREAVPDANTVTLWRDGPLQFSGDLTLIGAVPLETETRMTLCRCGASKNKPFCDNSHRDVQFSSGDAAPAGTHTVAAQPGGHLTITALPDASLRVDGGLEIRDEAGVLVFSGESASLCRCGGSNNKPFCDGTHLSNGFQAD